MIGFLWVYDRIIDLQKALNGLEFGFIHDMFAQNCIYLSYINNSCFESDPEIYTSLIISH